MGEHMLTCKSDRISDLPGEVKDTILTFLPLREAVRASILSTKWRYCWTNLSKLTFDDTIFRCSNDSKLIERYKLISTINHILLLRDEPINEFSLSHSALETCPEIDHFTIFLSKKSVLVFSLKILTGRKHKLHSSFFSCQELTHIDLSSCIFIPPPTFKGFFRLVILKLVNSVFTVESFGSFVSSCPQLESLTLINPPKFHHLAVSASKLKHLHFEGNCEFIRLGDAPFLQSATFYLQDSSKSLNEEICEFVEFIRGLPSLKKLVANYLLLLQLAAGGGVPKNLPTSVTLETLKLSKISFDRLKEASIIFSLISSCPNIRRIEIEIFDGVNPVKVEVDQVLEIFKAQDFTASVTLNELREVLLTCVSGVEPELEFIKLLLAKSPSLKTMLIKTKNNDDFSRLELLKKLTRFRRASSMAEIIYE